ncbi:MAG: site-2 protease family protein [Bdellovibrio sp.]|nr:site-2 protease family protein [Methylotenera sp.]
MEIQALIIKIAIAAVPILLAITVHEASHGYAAKYFGDSTAEKLGRISLNPFKHIDPVGTILLPTITLILGGVLFGWAKPVPVNFGALRNPKKDMLWVAAAGPASNLVMAIAWSMLLGYIKYALSKGNFSPTFPYLLQMCFIGVSINVVLMVLNLLPMPPLDGGRIAVSLLPNSLAFKLAQVEKYGFVILIALMLTGVLNMIIGPFIDFFQSIILRIFA